MIAVLLVLAGLVVLVVVAGALLAVTGGRGLVTADHDLPEPARHARRAPKGT